MSHFCGGAVVEGPPIQRARTVYAAFVLIPAVVVEIGGSVLVNSLQTNLPAQLVADFHSVCGDPHARAVHAKGIILEGSFEPSEHGPSTTKPSPVDHSSPSIRGPKPSSPCRSRPPESFAFHERQ